MPKPKVPLSCRPCPGRAAAAWLAAPLLAAAALPSDAKTPPDTAVEGVEYAVRWSSADGGPASAAEALQRFGLKAKGDPETFTVRYFDLPAPPGMPAGFTPILRRRDDGREVQFTLKLRGPAPYPAASLPLAAWRCLLPEPTQRKDEADVFFLADGTVKTVHSRSCTSRTVDRAAAPPADLRAVPKPCAAEMRRLEARKDRLETTAEQWTLDGGAVLVEMSRRGGSAEDFRQQVVAPLLAAGIRPLDRSKSELGSDCR